MLFSNAVSAQPKSPRNSPWLSDASGSLCQLHSYQVSDPIA